MEFLVKMHSNDLDTFLNVSSNCYTLTRHEGYKYVVFHCFMVLLILKQEAHGPHNANLCSRLIFIKNLLTGRLFCYQKDIYFFFVKHEYGLKMLFW